MWVVPNDPGRRGWTPTQTVDLDALKCASCKTAFQSDGACAHCSVGFADKKVYHSGVAYRLVKGETKDLSDIGRPTCRKSAEKPGWCGCCKVGMVGSIAFEDEKESEQAAEAREVLLSAAANKCEACAVALVTNGKCDVCKVEYKDGKKLAPEKPKASGD